MQKPHLYIDTNVILDAILERKQASSIFLEQAKKNNWKCSTSRWTMIELLDNMQEERFVEDLRIEGYLFSRIRGLLGNRRQKEAGLKKPELDQVWKVLHDKLSNEYSFIKFKHPLTVSFWDKAEDYASSSNIGATDSIHLATALRIRCNILVTSDQDFIAIANEYILATLPSGIDIALAKLNRA
jgi:predicted nucleic acid-binding protein